MRVGYHDRVHMHAYERGCRWNVTAIQMPVKVHTIHTPATIRYGRRFQERKRNGKQLGMDGETERNGTGQIPPMRLTACTIPYRPYGRPDICGDQRSISRQSKREGEANRGPIHSRMEIPKKQRSQRRRKILLYLLYYFLCGSPFCPFPPFRIFSCPCFLSLHAVERMGKRRRRKGNNTLEGAHGEEEEREGYREVGYNETCKGERRLPEWDGPPPPLPQAERAPQCPS